METPTTSSEFIIITHNSFITIKASVVLVGVSLVFSVANGVHTIKQELRAQPKATKVCSLGCCASPEQIAMLLLTTPSSPHTVPLSGDIHAPNL